MGLDMYLTKRQYVKNWGFMHPEERHSVIVKRNNETVTTELPVESVVYEAAYWRKANAVHQWFVDHVQDGEDDCKEYYVDREQLQELVDTCNKVLAIAKTEADKVLTSTRWTEAGVENIYEDGLIITNPEQVAEILPTSSGFFFGSTEYDGYYLQDVKDTIAQLNKVLDDELEGDFYYRSSW